MTLVALFDLSSPVCAQCFASGPWNTPNYMQLFNACYPASSALVAAPEPSRLAYYALVPQNLLSLPVNLRTADIIIAAN